MVDSGICCEMKRLSLLLWFLSEINETSPYGIGRQEGGFFVVALGVCCEVKRLSSLL